MRLAEDDRGRVPFALVGVLLLVGSASYAATLAHRPPAAERPDAVASMNRVDGTVATAVHRGTKHAARAAARAPVVEPSATTGGRVLNDTNTFRDYLRLRVYLAVRDALADAAVTVGGTQATPSLSATDDDAALRAAKRRVALTRVDGGIRVRIENVTIRLRSGGRVLETRSVTMTRTVATPVLAVHDRVRRYERRLDRGPGEGPGLGRRLTARMNAIAWTRGYAQYGGAPIPNVVTNRHIELQANGALLASQQAVFGRSDRAGRGATRRATAIVGATDVLMGGREALDTRKVLPDPDQPAPPGAPSPPAPTRPPGAVRGNVTVGVDLTADEAFTAFVSGDGGPTLSGTIASVYGADVRLVGASATVASSRTPRNRPQGEDWHLVGERTTRNVSIEAARGPGPSPTVQAGWHPLANYTRRVTVVRATRYRWARGEARETRTTTGIRTEVVRATVALVGQHATTPYAPIRGIADVHHRGGPLDGPNLAGVAYRARERVDERFGSPDELVRLYADGTLPGETLQVLGVRPPQLPRWLSADLARLRERVRNLSVTVRGTRLGAGQVNPAALLAERLRDRRAALVDAPATYGSVAVKARVAARSAYLSLVVERLERRAADARRTRSGFDRLLDRYGVDPGTLAAALDAGASTERPAAHPVARGGPLGPLNATVSATPAYLTLAGLTHERRPAVPAGERYHPLVARNLNVFTVPYGDAADGVVDQLFAGEGRTDLDAAARTLQSTNRALDTTYDPELARRRDALRSSVRASLAHLRGRLVVTLVRSGNVPRDAARATVDAGFDQWETPAARGLAASNGSLAAAIARVAARRAGGGALRRPLLTARLRVALAKARRKPAARPPQPVVNRTATLARTAATSVVETAVSRGASVAASTLERRLGDQVTFPPAGLPLAPVPGYWYATTNVWALDVRGEYLRLAVTVPTAAPGRDLTYVRERSTVAVDWDGDGRAEPLGRSTRVSFSVTTAVVVVVPPGGVGVGDRDGDADERSAGWPRPGNATGR